MQVNTIRASLSALSRGSSAIGLPQPHLNRTALCDLPDAEFEPAYLQRRDDLRAHLHATARAKSLRGAPLDGRGLADLVEALVAALNDQEFPTAGSMLEAFNQRLVLECSDGHAAALAALPLPVDEVRRPPLPPPPTNPSTGWRCVRAYAWDSIAPEPQYSAPVPRRHGFTYCWRMPFGGVYESMTKVLLEMCQCRTPVCTLCISVWFLLRRHLLLFLVRCMFRGGNSFAAAEVVGVGVSSRGHAACFWCEKRYEIRKTKRGWW